MDFTTFEGLILLVVTILGATVTYLFNSHIQRKTAKYNSDLQRAEVKRAQTFHLLSRIFEPGPVGDARLKMAKWIADGKVIDYNELTPEEDDVILSIIDFYEFVCEGALKGKTVDKELLDQESGGRIERYYFLIKDYIHAREKRLTEVSKKNGGKPVILYEHIKLFLTDVRKIDI